MYLLLKNLLLYYVQKLHTPDQVRIKIISQLIKGISRVLQKLLKYFNGTAILTLIIRGLLVFPRNFDLDLNVLDLVILSFG